MVDDVVVDERGGVEELQGGGRLGESGPRSRTRGGFGAGDELVPPPQEDRADALAAAGERDEALPDLRGVR